MKEVLSLFSSLGEVIFRLWHGCNRNTVPDIPEDVKVAHAKIWRAACPELISVRFLDGSWLRKADGWTSNTLIG